MCLIRLVPDRLREWALIGEGETRLRDVSRNSFSNSLGLIKFNAKKIDMTNIISIDIFYIFDMP